MAGPVTIGAVSYLNTRPLVYGLEQLIPEGSVEYDLPSRLAMRLAAREFDVALIPVTELFGGSPYTVVSDACIACDGPVWSVKLLSRVEPQRIRSVALDEGSRTSVCLTRLLLWHHWKVNPAETLLPVSSDWRSAAGDAVLIIGDRAMHDYSGEFPFQWDLGREWKSWTGLPFVFAVWAAHRDAPLERLDGVLSQARDRGLAAAGQIAASSAAEFGLSEAQCRNYLLHHLRFGLGPGERAGLSRFVELAAASRLIESVSEIRYYHHDCPVA